MSKPGTSGHKQIGRHDAEGCTVTIVRRSDPLTTRSIARRNVSRIAALRDCLDGLDPAEWRVLAISTPQTIYDDLTGSRALNPMAGKLYRGRSGRNLACSTGGATMPEPTMLGRAGLGAFR